MIVYFSGIGSVKISPIAEVAFDLGYKIYGSEKDTNSIISRLVARGIEVDVGYQNGNYLEKINADESIDYFIKDDSIGNDHPEMLMAIKLNISIITKDELLSKIIAEKKLKLIAVGGSSGKTTTTAMIIWIFKRLKIPISYCLQEEIKFGPSGCYENGSKYFIYECDEYNKNFLAFKPYLTLITSISYTHPETYEDEADYQKNLHQFAKQSAEVISWKTEHSEVFDGLKNIKFLDESDIYKDIELISPNAAQNTSLIKACMNRLNITNSIGEFIKSFPGLSRRFEKLAENYYVDCGRNPIELEAVVNAAIQINPRLCVVYQPYSNKLQKNYIGKYTTQLKDAEKVYWLPVYPNPEEKNMLTISSDELINHLVNKDRLEKCELDDQLWDKIEQNHMNGMLVLCVGAGSIDGWIRGRMA